MGLINTAMHTGSVELWQARVQPEAYARATAGPPRVHAPAGPRCGDAVCSFGVSPWRTAWFVLLPASGAREAVGSACSGRHTQDFSLLSLCLRLPGLATVAAVSPECAVAAGVSPRRRLPSSSFSASPSALYTSVRSTCTLLSSLMPRCLARRVLASICSMYFARWPWLAGM